MRYGLKRVVYGISSDVLVVVLTSIGRCGGGDGIIFLLPLMPFVVCVLCCCLAASCRPTWFISLL